MNVNVKFRLKSRAIIPTYSVVDGVLSGVYSVEATVVSVPPGPGANPEGYTRILVPVQDCVWIGVLPEWAVPATPHLEAENQEPASP